jgi:hypothetical protein
MSSDAFGPKLRWQRIRHGASLEQISADTKVPIELWDAMERSDFSAWPSGLYARAYIRHYAEYIGLDGDEVVDEFCRLFPKQGDRRRERLVRGQAEIVGHRFATDEEAQLPPGVLEDRRAAGARARTSHIDLRIVAAIADQGAVLLVASGISFAVHGHFWTTLAIVALIYHGAGMASAGCSAGAYIVRTYAPRQPRPAGDRDVFALPRTIEPPLRHTSRSHSNP